MVDEPEPPTRSDQGAGGEPPGSPPLWPEIRVLLLAAMVFFVFTIGIGILNGMDLVEFDQRRILGHVHAGTLGWLTLVVFAAALWLFGGEGASEAERRLIGAFALASAVVFGLYVVAFSTTYGKFRPAMGGLSLLLIVIAFGWIAGRARSVTLGAPHLGFLAAVATSVVGGVVGVLWAIDVATESDLLSVGGRDAHPAVMVVGFLFPVSLGLIEWAYHFPSPEPAGRLGAAQMAFPFVGGLVLLLALLLDIDALAPPAILLEVIGVIIFLRRMWSNLTRTRLTDPGPARFALMGALGAVFVIGLAQYFVIRYEGDFDLVPVNQLLALDHAQFIGAMTMAVFAVLAAIGGGSGDRRTEDITFWLVTVGLIVFLVGLMADASVLKRIGAPTMGVGLLVGLWLFAAALKGPKQPAVQ